MYVYTLTYLQRKLCVCIFLLIDLVELVVSVWSNKLKLLPGSSRSDSLDKYSVFQGLLREAWTKWKPGRGPRSTPGPAGPGAPCWSRLHLAWWLLRAQGAVPLRCSVAIRSWGFGSRTFLSFPVSFLGTTSFPAGAVDPWAQSVNLTEVTFSGNSISQTLSPLLYPSVGDTGEIGLSHKGNRAAERVKLRP